jgi:hypothetical protein
VCSLAERFAAADWEVIILDVLSDTTAGIYRHRLEPFSPNVVQLLPTYSELRRRFYERGAVLTEDELKSVYEGQLRYTQYDLRIDNTSAEPQEVASQIASLL